MSFYESYGDDTASSWVLVYFVDSDPGKEFEIIARNRISCPENFVLRPQLKVKVFYGKAKIEAYVVQESVDYQYLQDNFDSLTNAYRDNTLNNYASALIKQRWKDEILDDDIISDEENMKELAISTRACCSSLQEKYDALKIKFNDLYRMQCVMRSTIDELVERVENHSVKKETNKSQDTPNYDDVEVIDDVVLIGDNKTPIAANVFNKINWDNCSAATRKLLVAAFSKNVLATHTLTGKPSPAFLNSGKSYKEQLDPCRTSDIINIVARRCKVSASVVRHAITTKCADENKMAKKRKRN